MAACTQKKFGNLIAVNVNGVWHLKLALCNTNTLSCVHIADRNQSCCRTTVSGNNDLALSPLLNRLDPAQLFHTAFETGALSAYWPLNPPRFKGGEPGPKTNNSSVLPP